MTTATVGELRFTVADLENLPDDGKRYEIIDGELYVTTSPRFEHQSAGESLSTGFRTWDPGFTIGYAVTATGLVFDDDESVIPDLIWTRRERLVEVFTHPETGQRDGHLHAAPDIAVEILSPGSTNSSRDRRTKRRLYSRRGVLEYWIVNPFDQVVEVYRRTEGPVLTLEATLYPQDRLESPLLPGFSLLVADIFVLPPELRF